MSRDFSPRDHLCSHLMVLKEGKQSPYFTNMEWHIGDTVTPMFTEEEMKDREKHKAMAIMLGEQMNTLHKELSAKEFGKVSAMLTRLMNKFIKGDSLDGFPEPVLTWFFNKNDYYYHEPNDAEFLEYLIQTYRGK